MLPLKLLQMFLSIAGDNRMQYCISFTLALGIILLLSTYFLTTVRYLIKSHFLDRRFKGNEPATLPYWIPFIGSALDMIESTQLLGSSFVSK